MSPTRAAPAPEPGPWTARWKAQGLGAQRFSWGTKTSAAPVERDGRGVPATSRPTQGVTSKTSRADWVQTTLHSYEETEQLLLQSPSPGVGCDPADGNQNEDRSKPTVQEREHSAHGREAAGGSRDPGWGKKGRSPLSAGVAWARKAGHTEDRPRTHCLGERAQPPGRRGEDGLLLTYHHEKHKWLGHPHAGHYWSLSAQHFYEDVTSNSSKTSCYAKQTQSCQVRDNHPPCSLVMLSHYEHLLPNQKLSPEQFCWDRKRNT